MPALEVLRRHVTNVLQERVSERICEQAQLRPAEHIVDEFVYKLWRKVRTWSKHVRQDRMLQRAVERTPDESVFLRERVQQQTAKQIEDAQDRDQILDVPTLLTEEHLVEVPGSVFEEKNLAPLTCR